MYEEGSDSAIAPLVYVQDVSTNGTIFVQSYMCGTVDNVSEGLRLNDKMGAVLLNDGDQLRIGKSTCLTYHNAVDLRSHQEPISKMQALERQAGYQSQTRCVAC